MNHATKLIHEGLQQLGRHFVVLAKDVRADVGIDLVRASVRLAAEDAEGLGGDARERPTPAGVDDRKRPRRRKHDRDAVREAQEHGNARSRADDGVRPLERLGTGGLDGLSSGVANDDHLVPVDLLGLHEVAGDACGSHGGKRTRAVLRDIRWVIAAARPQVQARELAF